MLLALIGGRFQQLLSNRLLYSTHIAAEGEHDMLRHGEHVQVHEQAGERRLRVPTAAVGRRQLRSRRVAYETVLGI